MRTEFTINVYWRQVAECDCGNTFILNYVMLPTAIHTCPTCTFEVMKTRRLIENLMKNRDNFA